MFYLPFLGASSSIFKASQEASSNLYFNLHIAFSLTRTLLITLGQPRYCVISAICRKISPLKTLNLITSLKSFSQYKVIYSQILRVRMWRSFGVCNSAYHKFLWNTKIIKKRLWNNDFQHTGQKATKDNDKWEIGIKSKLAAYLLLKDWKLSS